MKRLVNPQPNGGVPLTNEYFLTLQNEGFDHLKQLLVGLNSPMVLSGCYPPLTTVNTSFRSDGTESVGASGTGSGPVSLDTLSSGYVWIDGDILYFPGTILAAPFYIKADVPSYTRAALQDGTNKNVYVTSNAVATTSRPTSGQYITCNPAPTLRFQSVVNAPVQTALMAEINTRQTQNAAEVTARTNADTQLNQRLSALSDVVDTKATKKIGFVDWTDLPLSSGFTTDTGLAGSFNTAQYMRTEDGFVHLRGVLHFASNAPSVMCTLPNGFGVYKESRFTTFSLVGFPVVELGVRVAVSGNNIFVFPNSVNQVSQLTIFLDGMNYYADGLGGVQ